MLLLPINPLKGLTAAAGISTAVATAAAAIAATAAAAPAFSPAATRNSGTAALRHTPGPLKGLIGPDRN